MSAVPHNCIYQVYNKLHWRFIYIIRVPRKSHFVHNHNIHMTYGKYYMLIYRKTNSLFLKHYIKHWTLFYKLSIYSCNLVCGLFTVGEEFTNFTSWTSRFLLECNLYLYIYMTANPVSLIEDANFWEKYKCCFQDRTYAVYLQVSVDSAYAI